TWFVDAIFVLINDIEFDNLQDIDTRIGRLRQISTDDLDLNATMWAAGEISRVNFQTGTRVILEIHRLTTFLLLSSSLLCFRWLHFGHLRHQVERGPKRCYHISLS